MYVFHNTEAHSRNHCCRRRAVSITYFECVFVALVTQHCTELCCHLWPVRLYNIFSHYLINGTVFGKKDIEHKMCLLNFSIKSV
jgi:hypothetical protein